MECRPDVDEFETIAFCETREYDRGYNDGSDYGIILGRQEGFSMGLKHGREASEELVFYLGFCEMFQKVMDLSDKNSPKFNVSKLRPKLIRIISLIKEISSMPVGNEKFSECANDIRTFYRNLSSLLKVRVKFSSESGGNSNSF